MDILDLSIGSLPVIAELLLARQCPLSAGKTRLMFPEGVERFDMAAIAKNGKSSNPHVDTDNGCCRRNWIFYFPFSLDGYYPIVAGGGNRDVLRFTEKIPAVTIGNQFKFRKEDPGVPLIQLESLWKTETVDLAFFLETGAVCTFFE